MAISQKADSERPLLGSAAEGPFLLARQLRFLIQAKGSSKNEKFRIVEQYIHTYVCIYTYIYIYIYIYIEREREREREGEPGWREAMDVVEEGAEERVEVKGVRE